MWWVLLHADVSEAIRQKEVVIGVRDRRIAQLYIIIILGVKLVGKYKKKL